MSRFRNLEIRTTPAAATAQPRAESGAELLRDAEQQYFEGDYEAALRLYDRALDHHPMDAAAWVGQTRMLIELNEFAQAKALADKALEKLPEHPELLATRAVALAREGQIEPALAFSDAAVHAAPNHFQVWLARGDVLLAAGESNSEICFDQAVTASGGTWLVHWLASRIHFFHAKFTLALKYAQQALAVDASRGVVWLQLGRCQEALGLAAPAAASFRHALELNPDSVSAKIALTSMTDRSNLFRRALGVLRRFNRS